MTIGEFYDCLNGYRERIREEMAAQDMLNHILASYIATGVNNPKKFPKKPALEEVTEEDRPSNGWTATTDEELMRRRRIQYGKR